MHDLNRDAGDKAIPPVTWSIGADSLFMVGPLARLGSRSGSLKPDIPLAIRHMLVFVLVAWVPLVILAALEGNLYSSEPGRASFIRDVGALARYAIAGPLLLAADAVAVAALSRMADRFFELCAPTGAEHARLVAAFVSVRKLRDAPLASLVIVALAYIISIATVPSLPLSELPAWHLEAAGHTMSWAGWWSLLVSLPLLLTLLLRWIWRLILWARFLRLASRVDLQLIPVHPDKAAGVAFLGYSLRACCLAGAALGAMFAGAVGNQVLYKGATLADYQFVIAGLVVCTVALFIAPLLAFSGKLLEVWRRGVHDYDELASEFGRQFEREWFGREHKEPVNMLDRGDFSAGTDLFQVADRVHEMRLVPVDLLSIAILAGATLVPFVPILFLVLPFDKVLRFVFGILH